jgi:methyl-accepting chemotaxis protein
VTAPERYAEQTLALPIINESGPVGAVIARIDLTTLWDIVSDVELGQRGYAYLVDDQGLPCSPRS